MKTSLLEEVDLFLRHFLHFLIRLFERCTSRLGFVKNLFGSLQKHIVFLDLVFVSTRIQWVQMLKLSHALPLLFVLDGELLLSDGIFLLLTHSSLSVVPGEHPSLLFYLLLSLVTHLPLDRET